MQTVSTSIRVRRAGVGVSEQVREASRAAFAAQQKLVSALQEQILLEGQPEVWSQAATATHFRLRRGEVGGEQAEAQVYTHPLGIVIRFWVYGPDFQTKTRDLVLLRMGEGEKGYEVWLDDGSRVFPHEGGKYAQAGQKLLAHLMSGR